MTSKNLKFTKNLRYGAKSYLDMVLSICEICLSIAFGDNRKVFKGSLEVHGQVE